MFRNSSGLLILFLIAAKVLSAQPVISVSEIEDNEPVGLSISYYHDTTHQLRLSDVLSDSLDQRFIISTKEVLNFGLSDATYWLRFRVKNAHPKNDEWFVELAYPLLDSVFFYQTLPDGSWQQTISGELVGINKLPVLYKHFLFPIEQSDTLMHTYYLRVRTKSAARFPVFIRQAEAFFDQVAVEEIFFGIFYGAMLVMILYNLFLFFALRELGYLYYCIFIFLNACVQATFNGHIQLAGFAVSYANTWLLLTMFGTAFFGVIFTINFLQTDQVSPLLHRLLLGGAAVAGLFSLLAPVLPYHISAVFASLLFLVVPLVTWVSGLVAWRKGNSSARYFVAAWALYLFSVTLISLRTLGLIPGSMPLEIVMQIGSVLDAVILSLALADRINVYRKERAAAQKQALKAAQEKEQMVQQQNQLLERRVAERTEEIAAQNEEMQVQQETIETLNSQLIAQNEDLERKVNQRTSDLAQSNKQLVNQNQILEQFASVTSHNLRGPIASILGLGSIMDRENLNELNQQCLGYLHKTTQELDEVIKDLNQLLTYTNDSQQRIEQVYFKEALGQALQELAPAIAQHKVRVVDDLGQSDTAMARASFVESIFFHLVSNAIKFRKLSESPTVRISSQRTAEHIIVSVKDNGLGIDTTKHGDKIFALYQKFHTHRKGRGLGLYLVKTQLEALGGNITLESEVGVGTTVHLYFCA